MAKKKPLSAACADQRLERSPAGFVIVATMSANIASEPLSTARPPHSVATTDTGALLFLRGDRPAY